MSHFPLRTLFSAFFLTVTVGAYGISAADPATETRKRLLENQRNLYLLRKEREEYRSELEKALQQLKYGDHSDELATEISGLRDSLAMADDIINNVNETISRQRLLLGALERATAASTLDMALNKALNANLSDVAKKLAGNENARRELVRLRSLLKQQAGLSTANTLEMPSAVSFAAEQQKAQDEYLRLLEVISTDSYKGEDDSEDKPIKISGIDDREPFTHKDTLNYVGQSQYHLETTVYAGKMTFTVDGHPWHLTVPPEENKSTYIVIYDDANPARPRLVMFNKSLLTE